MFIRQYRQRSIIDVYNKKCKKTLHSPKKFIVYKHTNIVNGKCYVGKTCGTMKQRWNGHIGDSRKGSKFKFHNAIRKYGEEVWTHEVLEELQTELFCNASEIYWIDKFQSADKRYGYNLTHGGDSNRPNAETREKMSESQKGKKLSEETRLKIGENNGSKRPEVRQKMSDNNKGDKNPMFGKPPHNKGKKQSPETIAKRVKTQRRNREAKLLTQ